MEFSLIFTLLVTAFYPVSSEICSTVVNYELHSNTGEGSMDDLLKEIAKLPPVSGGQEHCVNITLYEGRYIVTEGVNIYSGSLKIEAVGKVVIEFGRSMMPGDPGSNAIDISNVLYVEFIGVEFIGITTLLTFQDIQQVILRSCVFRDFQQGCLDIWNCLKVEITNSTFIDNGQQDVVRLRGFQGGSGGLSLQYTRDITFPSMPYFKLQNLSFINNSALSIESDSSMFSEVTFGNDFTGRGGAIFLILQNTKSVIGVIDDCIFDNNTADLYGGAIYLAFNEQGNNDITIKNSIFTRNSAVVAGGAFMVSYQVGGDKSYVNSVTMTDCSLTHNQADYGGGVYFFISITSGREDGDLGCYAEFVQCYFGHNTAYSYGAAIGAGALNIFESKEETQPSVIRGCTFHNNTCLTGGGVVSISYFPFWFQGCNEIRKSVGPAMLVVGARIKVSDLLEFNNNDARGTAGGALYILSHGQVELKEDTDINFSGNRGNFGSSIVINIPNTPPTMYSKIFHNPICSFLYEDTSLPPDEWKNVNLFFEDNIADVGSAVYANYLDFCSWYTSVEPYFDNKKAYRWNTIEFGRGNKNKAHVSNVSNTEFLVQTPPIITMVTNSPIDAFPGENINIDIDSFSERGTLTYAIWRFDQESLTYDPKVIASRSNLDDPVTTSFTIDSSLDIKNSKSVSLTANVETVLTEDDSRDEFVINLRNCPPGKILSDFDNQFCICNEERTEILECGDKNITLSGHLWATLSRQEEDALFTYSCPPRHCQCSILEISNSLSCYNVFDEDATDSMCDCSRTGILCGECKNNSGVSVLLNKCVSCNDGYSALIPLLIIADIVIFIVILVVMVPIPNWLLPPIFYLQMLPLLTENFPSTFDQIHPALYYISSAMGFYFPYDFCLYNNMSVLVSYVLRFIPAILASIVVPITVILRNYIYRPTTLHGVWLIILLLYTPTLYASLGIFNCPSIPISNDNGTISEPRWFYNGSVACFTDGGHGGLVFLGLLGLIACLAFPPIVSLLTLNKIKRFRSPRHLCDALKYHYSIDNNLWWWSGIELARRIPLLIFIISLPLNSYPNIMILSVYILIAGLVQPYRTKLANVLELILCSLTLILLLIPQVDQIEDSLDIYTLSSGDNISDLDRCDVELNVTPFVWLLMPFYYIPLVVTVTVGVVLSIIWLYKYIRTFKLKKTKKVQTEGNKTDRKFSMRIDVAKQRERVTSSEVSIELKPLNISTVKYSESKITEECLADIQEEDIKEDSM